MADLREKFQAEDIEIAAKRAEMLECYNRAEKILSDLKDVGQVTIPGKKDFQNFYGKVYTDTWYKANPGCQEMVRRFTAIMRPKYDVEVETSPMISTGEGNPSYQGTEHIGGKDLIVKLKPKTEPYINRNSIWRSGYYSRP